MHKLKEATDDVKVIPCQASSLIEGKDWELSKNTIHPKGDGIQYGSYDKLPVISEFSGAASCVPDAVVVEMLGYPAPHGNAETTDLFSIGYSGFDSGESGHITYQNFRRKQLLRNDYNGKFDVIRTGVIYDGESGEANADIMTLLLHRLNAVVSK